MAYTENNRKLRYEAELNPFMDFIEANYSESSLCVFRSTLSDPPTEKDSTPQSKRSETERGEELELTLTKEDVEGMTDDEKKLYVGSLAISVFRSEEKAQKNVFDMVKHIAKNFSPDEALAYLQDKRGPYIVKLQLSPDVGLLENRFNKKGHANLLLYEGVDISEQIIEILPPIKFEDIIQKVNKKDIDVRNSE